MDKTSAKLEKSTFNITPDPRVLIALTHTPLQPLDAVCELIDNGLDSFSVARLQGIPIEFPLITLELPGPLDVTKGEGIVRVRDNGPGMTPELAEKAITAGFSGNNPYDTLGLFGMGLNIATGKLGRITRFSTARKGELATVATIDLPKLQQSGRYEVPVERMPRPQNFEHGTIVEVSGWWDEGNPNSGFIKKLSEYPKRTVREELGRRYATLLRDHNVRILVNGDPCTAFEHCVWDRTRFVERRGYGQIPAIYDFNAVLAHQTRCTQCWRKIEPGESECQTCTSRSFRTVDERVRGWVGIQRFDDRRRFGIDLIRNGRAIRILEQNALFEFTDELKRTVKDYPIDQDWGRIVGEVHLDHVPVDFMKQDFQRSSEEWRRAMSFLRGESSLQPEQPNADKNDSIIFKLYQGYRKVRNFGRRDMYMGYYDPKSGKAKRISRDIEQDYYKKFLDRIPGYYDDSEWWKLVEQADQPPLPELSTCPNCQVENLKTSEQCQVCGHILLGKACIECNAEIPQSAVSCPTCGGSQVPEIEEPWNCKVCGTPNSSDAEVCITCARPVGSESPTSATYLQQYSDKSDDLSLPGQTLVLADGNNSQPIDVHVMITRGSISPWAGPTLPLIAFRELGKISVFLDSNHRIFRSFRALPEQMIAAEVASYIYDTHRALIPKHAVHSLANLTWQVLESRWADVLEESDEQVRDAILNFFDQLRVQLPTLVKKPAELFDELSEEQKKSLVENMLSQGVDIGQLGEMKASGVYLKYLDEDSIVEIVRGMPEQFFDGQFWSEPYNNISELPESVLRDVRFKIRSTYLNCLEDVAAFKRYRAAEPIIAQRAQASLEYLNRTLV